MRLSSLFSPSQWFSYLRSLSVASFLLVSRFVSTNKKQHRMNLCWLRRMCKNLPDLWLCYFSKNGKAVFTLKNTYIGFRPVNCRLDWSILHINHHKDVKKLDIRMNLCKCFVWPILILLIIIVYFLIPLYSTISHTLQ